MPGWTLPGVMTTGAAQTLLRSYRVLAGRRVLLAGNGPLNIQVALELARAGAEVLAVVELAPKPGPWALPALGRMLSSTPALAFRGMRQIAELKRRGAAMLHGSVLSGVTQIAGGLRAEVKAWPAGGGARVFEVDAVAMGYGFQPSNEILRALGCAHRFDPARGHLVTERDAEGRTTHPRDLCRGGLRRSGRRPGGGGRGRHRRPRRRPLPGFRAKRRAAAGGSGGENGAFAAIAASRPGSGSSSPPRASWPSSPSRIR